MTTDPQVRRQAIVVWQQALVNNGIDAKTATETATKLVDNAIRLRDSGASADQGGN